MLLIERWPASSSRSLSQVGRRATFTSKTRAEKTRAEFRRLDRHAERLIGGRPRFGEAEGKRLQGKAVERRGFAGDAVHVHRVDTVRGDVEVEDRLFAEELDAVAGETHTGQIVGELLRLDADVDEVLDPGNRDSHANCSRKRTSLS